MNFRNNVIKVIIATVLVLCALLGVSCGGETEDFTVEDCFVYTADKLIISAVSTNDIKVIYRSGNEPYIHCVSNGISSAKSSYIRFDFYPENKKEENFIPDFKVKDYPYLVVGYRSDILTEDNSLSVNAGMKVDGGVYNRFWGLKTFMRADGESHKAIYDLSATSGFDGGDTTWDGIDADSGVKYVRIPAWAHSVNCADSAGEYFDVEYIGFFRTIEDAQKYNGYDNNDDTKFTVVYKDEDGTLLGEIAVFKGSKAMIPEPPMKRGKLFDGWKAADGQVYKEDIRVNAEMELTAVYKDDPNASDRVEIVANADFYGYTAKEIANSGLLQYNGYSENGIMSDNGHEYYRLITPGNAKSVNGDNHNATFKFDLAYFNIHSYPYLAIGYRTNISTSDRGVASVGLKTANKYSRFWGLDFELVNDGNPAKAVVDVRNVTGGEKGVKFGYVDYDSSVSYVRVSSWLGNADSTTVKDEYFDVEYIAFFKTLEDAEAFEYVDGAFSRLAGSEHKAFMLEVDIGSFKPDDAFTYSDAAEVLDSLGLENTKYLQISSDIMSPEAFAELIDTVKVSADLNVSGLVESKNGMVTRATAAKALCIALDRKPSEKSEHYESVVGFTDVPENHPEYSYIIEATYSHLYVYEKNGGEVYTEVSSIRNYLKTVPDGLIEELNQKFADRVAQIRATESEWEVKEGGKIWYVSNDGNDKNSGLSPEEPIATLKELTKRFGYSQGSNKFIAEGDVVLFKRGDEWHGKLSLKGGITYSAYGEGEKPRILGSLEADNPEQWIETDVPGVYRFVDSLTASRDVGNIVLNNGQGYAHRVLKARETDTILQAGRDCIVGNGMAQWELDASKYTFADYKDLKKIADDIPEADFMYYHDRYGNALYLYSRNGNPGDIFDSIELCVKGNAVQATSNVIIDNLFVGYTGSHGIGSGSCQNLTVRNCEIGWIGGSVQNDDEKVRFGNAVEIYGAADGYYVYNNYIYQCFDCGPTVQVGTTLEDGKKIIQKDVAFWGNALWDADLEVWLSTHPENTEDTYAKLINCDLYDNYVIMSGYGFGGYNHQKNEYCSFYGAGETDADYIDCYVRDNYFWNLRYQLWKAVPTSMKGNLGFKWTNNVVIHRENALLGALGRDVYTATGGLTSYIYDEATISMLLSSKCLGMNTFYSLPSIGRDVPVNPMLPAPPVDEPYR